MHNFDTAADNQAEAIVERLKADPLLGILSGQDLSRLLAGAKIIKVRSGELLIKSAQPADTLFFLIDGKLNVSDQSGKKVEIYNERIGDETIAGFNLYTVNVVASEDSALISIPRRFISEAVSKNPYLRDATLDLFNTRMAQIPADNEHHQESLVLPKRNRTNVFGWVIACLSPLLLILFLRDSTLPYNIVAFLAALIATSCMWVFALVDEYVPLIFLIILSIAYDIVPADIALKGFGSEALFLFLGVYALGIVVDDSGISYRIVLFLLSRLPGSLFWQRTVLLITGFFFSPFLSSGNSRIAILQPLYTELLQCLDIRRQSRIATVLATACFSGAMLLSPIFLTSKPSNLIVAEMLPNELKEHFTQIIWVQGALVSLLILIIGHYLSDRLIFGNIVGEYLPRSLISVQNKLLGSLSIIEWIAISSLIFFICSAATAPFHNVSLSTISAVLLLSLLISGVITKSKLQQKVDWPTVLFLLSIDGLVSMIKYLGIQQYFIADIGNLIQSFSGSNVYIFLLFELILVALIRLFLPITAAMIVVSLLLMPLSPIIGISPWVIGFSAGMFSDLWIFPYQSVQYIQFKSRVGGPNGSYDERMFLLHNQLINVTRIAAVFLSVPYWIWLGLIP